MARSTEDNSDPSHLKDIPRVQPEDRPDYSKTTDPPAKLPASITATLSSDESMWKLLTEGKGTDSTETDYRYAAYAARARTILRSAHRYVAYTSDIGESFRPVAHPYLVKGAYAVSWAYLVGDVSHEGYKAYIRNQEVLHPKTEELGEDQEKVGAFSGAISANRDEQAQKALLSNGAKEQGIAQTAMAATKDLVAQTPATVAPEDDYRTVMVKRALFQGLASMGLPAFTIHSIVKYGGKAMKNVKNTRLRSYGPIGLGLATVPALPYLFDEPVEHAVEYIFHQGFSMIGKGQPEKEKEL